MSLYRGVAISLTVLVLLTGSTFTRADESVTTKVLHGIIVAYYQAIEENNIENAMRYYHSQAPHATTVRQELTVAMDNYLQTTATLTFSLVALGDGTAITQATHRVLILSGIKIAKRETSTTYRLRQEQGHWKIWLKSEQSLY